MHDENENVVDDEFEMSDDEDLESLGEGEAFEDEEDSYDPDDRFH
jgi:hypothetical protein